MSENVTFSIHLYIKLFIFYTKVAKNIKTTKFHLSYDKWFRCNKHIAWNFEYEKNILRFLYPSVIRKNDTHFLYPSGTSKTTECLANEIMPPTSDGWFLTGDNC